jgi:hypothetical protein
VKTLVWIERLYPHYDRKWYVTLAQWERPTVSKPLVWTRDDREYLKSIRVKADA